MKKRYLGQNILLALLVVSVFVSIICSSNIILKSKKNEEKHIELFLKNEASIINNGLQRISDYVEILSIEILNEIEDPDQFRDKEFQENYTNILHSDLESILLHNEDASFAYIRYDKVIAGSKAGLFLYKDGNDVVSLEVTDLSNFSSTDVEHVGWYYLPVNYRSPMWLEPYHNENVDEDMISYVSPLIKNDKVLGIVGVDILMPSINSMLENVEYSEDSFVVLLDRSNHIVFGDIPEDAKGYYTLSESLVNGMTLTVYVDEEDLYELRYSVAFQILFTVELVILILLLVCQLLSIFRRDGGENEDAMPKGKLVRLLHLAAVFIILAAQMIYLARAYIRVANIANTSINADNTYTSSINVLTASDFAPYSYITPEGYVGGYNIEMLNAMANEMGVNVNYTVVPANSLIEEYERGIYDVVLGIEMITNESYPFLLSDVVTDDAFVVYGKDTINSIQDLYSKNIAYINAPDPVDIYKLKDNATLFDDYESELLAVNNNSCDYAVVRKNSAFYIVNHSGYKSLVDVYRIMDSKICFGVRADEPDLLSRLNGAIDIVKREGIDRTLGVKWFEFTREDLGIVGIVSQNKGFIIVSSILLILLFIAFVISDLIYAKDSEIRNEKNQKKELQRISEVDELTGLFNRRYYERTLEELRLRKDYKDIAIVALDVNGLKETNDTLGHSAGDELLKGAAECIHTTFGNFGDCFRIGGDEFVVIAYGDIPDSDVISKAFRTVVAEWRGTTISKLAISFGVAYGRDYIDITADELVNSADQLMYADKVAFYQQNGIDRRGQTSAYNVLRGSYTKILKANLTDDSFSIIQMNVHEMTRNMGYSEKLSSWLHNFATSGQVYHLDRSEFIEKTDISFLRDYFKNNENEFCIQYKRKEGNKFVDTLMEIIPAPEYTDENQIVFLFVKSIAQRTISSSADMTNQELVDELQRRNSLEKLVREGLENEYFYLMYQPQYILTNHELRGFEALIRLKLPDGTMISPAEFIPASENSDLIMEIDDYVLHHALRAFRSVQDQATNKVVLSINISAKTIALADFVDKVKKAADTADFPLAFLELEITEYSVSDNDSQTIENINELRKLGVTIALDDFGTGYTSLAQLMRIPFDLLKIDKSLVDDIDVDKVRCDFCESVIALGHLVNSKVIAEGVEKEAQAELLKERGCDYLQGFLWGKPMYFEDAKHLVLDR